LALTVVCVKAVRFADGVPKLLPTATVMGSAKLFGFANVHKDGAHLATKRSMLTFCIKL
jgi:hypothetical protein